MKCNIDDKGRRIRRVNGYACCGAGLALLGAGLARVGPRAKLAGAGSLLIAGGAFQIYESRKGWCVLRAMGVNTPV
jgi:hypothetical protein